MGYYNEPISTTFNIHINSVQPVLALFASLAREPTTGVTD
jgi:hypothetical protein